MKMRLATPALVLVGILAFAACGGDDDGGSVLGRSSTTVKGSAAASSDETDATATDDTSSDDTDTTVADDSSSDDTTDTTFDFSGKGSKDFCNKLQGVAKDISLDDVDSATPADFKKSFEAGKDALDDLTSKAPDEIKDDFQTLAGFYDKLEPILEKYDFDFTKLASAAQSDPESFAAFQSAVSDASFEESTSRIDAYVTQVCGFSFGE